jgi:hypothetical protein
MPDGKRRRDETTEKKREREKRNENINDRFISLRIPVGESGFKLSFRKKGLNWI